jgi:hypothetical protein
MKAFCAIATVGLSLMALIGPATAQRGDGYGGGGYDRGYRGRDEGYRDDGYRDRGPRRERAYGFDEDEYLRCHPDVRRAVMSGRMDSGARHYRDHGRREGRRLSC